jgi:alkaline phosphatase D
MIWDGKGDSTEGDAWGAYPHERSALFRWLGENRISGVVLVGGDIHISRHMKYPTSGVGYDLHQFIISPLNDRVLPGFDLPDPTVVASVAEPWVFLKITADSSEPDPRLRAEWINRDGRRIMRHEMKASELRPAPGVER